MFATEAGTDIARLLLDLLIVIVAAKAAAELAERLRIPAVLGEILAGVAIGPSALGLIELGGERGISLNMLAEVGVLLLLLQVGMEMDLGELAKVGTSAVAVAIIGVIVPFGAGAGIGLLFGESTNTAVFIGAALTATSVGITARVFGDLRALATTEARIVLGAAVADDVLGLVILTVVVKVVTGGSVGLGTIASTLGLAVLFLTVTGVVGLFGVPKLLDLVHRRAASPAAVSVVALAVVIGFAELADAAKLAFIIGAFMAGLGLGRSAHHDRIARDLGAVGNILIPVFFAQIGINADLGAMFKPTVLGLAAVLCVVAVIGKLISALGTLGTRVDRILVGIGMIPRGEVGLIFASIGLANGVLDPDQYGGLILVVLVTTVITPPLLRWRLGRAVADTDEVVADDEPANGWIGTVGGEIELNAVPPSTKTVSVALATAARAPTARPSNELLDLFGRHRNVDLVWDRSDTPMLTRLLRSGEPRAWRFLDVAGVLERALPEVAEAMRRRRADIGDLDPAAALRFPVVERLDGLAPELGLAADDLMIAALVADVCADADDEQGCTLSLARRLVPEEEVERIATIVADAHLLRAGTHDPDGFERNEILQLATHLTSTRHTRDAYELALALGPLPTWQRALLDERVRQITAALEHPEVTGSEANNIAAARRVAAEHVLQGDAAAIERLRFATNSYLLSHAPEELARQSRLLEPLPRRGSVRISVSPEPEADRWKIDVACRDSAGLLAHLTEVLAEHGLDVAAAGIATWPDGGVLDSFVVATRRRPSAKDLALAFEAGLTTRLRVLAMPSLRLEFDNDALPWHTAVIVTGPDRPGALLAVSAAFAVADVVVNTARISTVDDTVNDRFTVSDRLGRKLDTSAMEHVRSVLADGPSRRDLRRRF